LRVTFFSDPCLNRVAIQCPSMATTGAAKLIIPHVPSGMITQ
jgi:hypothetical protein